MPCTDRSAPSPSATDPRVLLRREQSSWQAYLDLPDFTLLAERLPEVGADLRNLRAQFAGVAGAPMARGRLLYPGQKLRLSQWPVATDPLVRLEGGSEATNSLLFDQCVLSPGPRWLFRIRDPGFAVEVRGKWVRPGNHYVLLSEAGLSDDVPGWCVPTACATADVDAHTIAIPLILEADHLAALRALGLGVVADVEIYPAGTVPPRWDGEGRAEWLAGETPMLAVSSTRAIDRAIFSLDGERHMVSWPQGQERMFIELKGLSVRGHDLDVSLVLADDEKAVSKGTIEIVVRPPHTRLASGSLQEGLMILATPVTPTLTELWDNS